MQHDALGAHALEELGISGQRKARPLQAALASVASLAVGAGLPLSLTALAPQGSLIAWVSVMSLMCLAALGCIAARVGGSGLMVGAVRIAFWGVLSMTTTAGVGTLFGTIP